MNNRKSTQEFTIFNALVSNCGQVLTAPAIERIAAEICAEISTGPTSWAFSPASEAALREELEDAKSKQHKGTWIALCGEAIKQRNDAQQRLTVAEQKLGYAYDWGYSDGQNNPNGYSDKEDRDKCVAELLKPAEECKHSFHYFGTEQKRRRCNWCNKLEDVADAKARDV